MSHPYVLQPALQPRRWCGSVTGHQIAAMSLQYGFVGMLVLLGVNVLLAAGVTLVLFGVLVGAIPVPRLLTGAGFWTAAA
jgi:hypothetical protein